MITPSELMAALDKAEREIVLTSKYNRALLDAGYVTFRAGPVPELTEKGRAALTAWEAASYDVAAARKRADKTLMRE